MHTKPDDDIDKFPEDEPVDNNTYTRQERALMSDDFVMNVFCDIKTGQNVRLFETELESAINNPLLDCTVTTKENTKILWIRIKKDNAG